MPKMKSHSGAKKRFRRTGSGKIAFNRHSRNHLLMQKQRRQKKLPSTVMADTRDYKRILKALPNL